MRVVLCVHGFPPASESGSEIYAEAHASWLADRMNDEVLVLTRDNDPSCAEYHVTTERRGGYRVARINNTFRNVTSFEDSYRNESLGAVAARLIGEFQPDVAHIHHLSCLSTSIVTTLADRGVPIVLTLHDYWLMCHRGQLLDLDYQLCESHGPAKAGTQELQACRRCIGQAGAATPAMFRASRLLKMVEPHLGPSVSGRVRETAKTLATLTASDDGNNEAQRRLDHMREICAKVSHFLAPSQDIRRRFMAFGISPDKISVSRLGFDVGAIRDAAKARKAAPQLRLGFLGSLMISKAPDLLLQAHRKLPAARATVDLIGPFTPYHGDAGYESQLKALLPYPGVRMHGALSHSAIPEALASLDVLVVPSIWPENSPLVIHESFLAGIPVVASRIGGIPELIDDGRNGLLFHPGDVDDLTHALTRLLDDPALLDTLRQGIGEVRTLQDDVEATHKLYESFVGPSRQSSAKPRRRLVAIVINYKTPIETQLAIHSLRGSTRVVDQIVVVNNDPNDDHRKELTAGRDLCYIHTGKNLGFSGGVNVGIRSALEGGADLIFLLNSDAIVAPDTIGKLEEAIGSAAGAGVAGAVVHMRSAPGNVATAGISYDVRSGRMRNIGFGGSADTVSAAVQIVDAVSGCGMLIRREVFETIGLFDEEYFFSFEDIDFCLRARQKGFITIVAGNAVLHHEGSRSMGAASSQRFYFAARNHLRLAAHTSPTSGPLSALYRVSSVTALNLAHAIVSRGGTLRSRLRATTHGIRDHFAGRYGSGS